MTAKERQRVLEECLCLIGKAAPSDTPDPGLYRLFLSRIDSWAEELAELYVNDLQCQEDAAVSMNSMAQNITTRRPISDALKAHFALEDD